MPTIHETIEEKYGIDLGAKSDEKLYAYLVKIGIPSLAKLLKITKK